MSGVLFLTHTIGEEHGGGGQQRVAMIEKALASVVGTTYDRLICNWPSAFGPYRDRPEMNFLMKGALEIDGEPTPYVWWLHDYILGIRAACSEHAVKELGRKLKRNDVVVVDHLWLWPLLRRCILEGGWAGKVIYSSHNSEGLARERWLRNRPDSNVVELRTAAAISALERSLACWASMVICCSEEDADWYATAGAKAVSVVANGAWPNELPPLSELERYSEVAIYAASGWFPNVEGFERFVIPCLKLAKKPLHVIVTGGVAPLVETLVEQSRSEWVAPHAVELVGHIAHPDFARLYANAEIVLNPVVTGTGTNIKAAEALVQGKPMLTTSLGSRGYRDWAEIAGNWYVRDTVDGWLETLEDPSRWKQTSGEVALQWDSVQKLMAAQFRTALAGV